MNEIELFFKIVESEIRRKHIVYLKKQKCVSAAEPNSLGAETETDGFSPEPKKGKAKYVKRFNQGIETALKVLQSEFKRFVRRLKKEEKAGHKF